MILVRPVSTLELCTTTSKLKIPREMRAQSKKSKSRVLVSLGYSLIVTADQIIGGFYMKEKQVLVIGYSSDHCTQHAYKLAYEVGKEIALQGSILITGGLGGVMEAASKGAKNQGGLVVGIIPQDEKRYANAFCDVVISTGLGHSRNFVTAYSADAVIVIGGGIGTAIEVGVAYQKGKPIIAMKGSGGTADEIGGKYLDDRQVVKIMEEKDPRTAVEKITRTLTNLFIKEEKGME
jgi:uncharacterized protein (TIGR00725 family)